MTGYRAAITIPPKNKPYTQGDMDIVIGHPVILNLGIRGEGSETTLRGIIISAEIQDDGSAIVAMDVSP